MHEHIDQLKHSSTLVKNATYFAVTAAALCIFAKLTAWFCSGSVAILASLFDSILDIVASIINMIAIHYALQPPDNEHRFGHGKAEDLAVLSQSMFFGLSGFVVIGASLKRLFKTTPIENEMISIYLMLFSIIINVMLIIYQKRVIKATHSSVIKADNLHYVTDLLTNTFTICAIVLSYYFKISIADPIFAIIIALYILYGSWGLLQKAFNNLMDHEMSDENKNLIKEIITSHKRIESFHDLKTRLSGNRAFIQFHIVHNKDMTLSEAHMIAEDIEAQILKKIPNAEIIMHQDPDDIEEEISYKD
jgi:ferrous-iron efflux pump FieF